jgi:uncharacterized membrane protein HdeD (DUF308 family)
MSTNHESTLPDASTVSDHGRTLVGVGVVLSVLGFLAIVFPFVTGVSLSILLGALLVVGALVHAAHAFSTPGWLGSIAQVGLAILYAVAGIALLANPVLGLVTLTILLVAYFAVEGLVLVYMGLRLRPEGRWGWTVASGALSLVVAGLLFVGFPSTAAWAVGLLFGVNLLSTGLAMALMGRRGTEATAGAARPAV